MSDKRAYDITAFCETFGVGRSFVYEQMASGHLRARKVGRKNIITAEEAERWLAALPEARTVGEAA